MIFEEGMVLDSGSVINVEYNSQHTIYEHTAICTLNRGEYNFSTNPTLQMFPSSSISGSDLLFDALEDGRLTPYITSIGLYNSVGEMVAVAKLPRPIKRIWDTKQSFIVKFDI